MSKTKILILGAGSGGTMMANHLAKKLDIANYEITIVDQSTVHYYQPGFLFIPFDIYKEKDVIKSTENFINKKVELIKSKIEKINSTENSVLLSDGKMLNYDLLIIATGCNIAPQEIEGMKESLWYKDIFDFYTFEGAVALRDKLRSWQGGKLVMHIAEMPIKCPIAPLEFVFLADDYFAKKKMRDKVEIVFVTPLSGAFTKPVANSKLNYLLEEKKIKIEADFAIASVDNENKKIVDYAGREVAFDLLVTVPTNMGDALMERSGLGDELNFVPIDKNTLQSKAHENIFVIGDATNAPTSKAGSVAHFEAEILVENILCYLKGEPLKHSFDGHANCFIETGKGKGLLLDFSYEQEPVTGVFPLPIVGPMALLKESRLNHWGKLAFRWIYWNMLLKGIPIPFVSSHMTKRGKNISSSK